MNKESIQRERVEMLAAEFVDALRDGSEPTIEQYAADNPEQADQIRDLFPTILAMEKLKSEQETGSSRDARSATTDIERLGDLRIIREIGRGGMGVVYEAEQESLGRRVAVKVLPKQQLNSEKSLARFLRESKTAAKLHHTNIVSVLGVGADEGYHYYVMQYIRGVGLDEVIGHLGGSDSDTEGSATTVPPANLSAVAAELLEQAASGDSPNNRSSALDETLTSVGQLDDTDHSSVGGPDETGSSVAEPGTPKDASLHQPFAQQYWRSVASIGEDVANALDYAHEHGTLHRDIKPSNLLLDRDGEISVADFGLAKSIGQDDLSRTGDIVGTLRYMAPEQFIGSADERSDVYSLGITLYELVTLHPAYNESERAKSLIHGNAILPARPKQVRKDIPSDLETIILKAINIEPERRYQTAVDLATDLRRFCEDRPILARRTSSVERLWRWSRRNPAIATLCGVAVSLLVGIATVSMAASYTTNRAREAADQAREAADRTAEHAFEALDRIFDRLAPLPTVNPETFANGLTDENSEEEFSVSAAPPVLTKQSAALLDEMLSFYDKLAAEGNDDARYRERLAEANRRIGDIRGRLGQYELAESAYRKSLALYVAIDETEKSPRMTVTIAAIHNELGRSMRRPPRNRQREINSAAEFMTARKMLEPIAGEGSPAEIRYELANTYYLQALEKPRGRGGPGGGRGRGDFGHFTKDGRGGKPDRNDRAAGKWAEHRQEEREERESLAKAIRLLETLVAEHPDRPDYQGLLAVSYLESTKDGRIAHSSHGKHLRSEAIELLDGLVNRFPNNPDYRFALCAALSMGRPDSPRLKKADIEPYLKRLESAAQILSDLRRDYPNVPKYLSEQLHLFRHFSILKKRIGDREGMLDVHRAAARTYTEATKDAKTPETTMPAIHVFEQLVESLLSASRDSPENKTELLQEALATLQVNARLLDQQASSDSDAQRVIMRIRNNQDIIKVAKELGDDQLVESTIQEMKSKLKN